MPEVSFAYRITRYDPEDRDEHGHYAGTEPDESDHGPVEDAYVAAVALLLDTVGVTSLVVDGAERGGRSRTGMPGPEPDPGIPAHFGVDGRGFHDGAQVPVDVALDLVRTMLREDGGPWCRLLAPGLAVVEIGYSMHLYVGLVDPVPAAVAQIRGLGLFVEPWPVSWFRGEPANDDPLPAGESFWTGTAELARQHRRLLVQEQQAGNWVVWHDVDESSVPALRSAAQPGALLVVWLPLDDDLAAVVDRAAAGDRDELELVWRDAAGGLSSRWLDEADTPDDVAALLVDAVAAQLSDCWWPPSGGLLWGKVPAADLP
jgi:small subunit ribosomal protein S1